MDVLPNELLLHILEAAAGLSWPTLLRLSETSKTFNSLYTAQQQRFLDIALRSTTSTDFKWLPLMVLGNRNHSINRPDIYDYRWIPTRISMNELQDYTQYYRKHLLDGTAPTVKEMRRAVAAYQQVKILIRYCVSKSRMGMDAISIDPRPGWIIKLKECCDAEGWIHNCYNAMLQWSVYIEQDDDEFPNLPRHLLDPPFAFFADYLNATPEEDAILQKWDDDTDMRWDIMETFLGRDLWELIMDNRQEVEDTLYDMEDNDGTKDDIYEALLPMSLTLANDDLFASVWAGHILTAHGEDLTEATAAKRTDRDFNMLVWIVMKVFGRHEKKDQLLRYIRRSFDGHYVQAVRRDHTIDYRLMTEVRTLHQLIE